MPATRVTSYETTDWTDLSTAPNTVTANGNRSYSLVFDSTDYTGLIQPGTRVRTTRTVAAPTQCTSLNGSTQYYSRASALVAGMTFTDDFVVSAWVKLTSYTTQRVVSRWNGTSGWVLEINSTGQVLLFGNNGGPGNYSQVVSYQSLPLNKWVHVAAQLDMSSFTATTTTSYIMFDGVDIPAAVGRGGTNPTALVQAGNLEIGSANAATFYGGKIAQVAIFNAKVTQATIRGYISQGLAGNETSLISAYSFNNSINDLNTTNANNLTANGSAVATNADSPFGGNSFGNISSTLGYGIVQSSTFSTNTTLVVQVPEGCTIPTSGGVTTVSYSALKAPYGMPTAGHKWELLYISKTQVSTGTVASSATITNLPGYSFTTPIGFGELSYSIYCQMTASATTYLGFYGGLSTANNTFSDKELMQCSILISISNAQVDTTLNVRKYISNSSATVYYFNMQGNTNTTVQYANGNTNANVIRFLISSL